MPDLKIKGVCKCGSDKWKWNVKNAEIRLACTGCGRSIRFILSFALLDILSRAIKFQES